MRMPVMAGVAPTLRSGIANLLRPLRLVNIGAHDHTLLVLSL